VISRYKGSSGHGRCLEEPSAFPASYHEKERMVRPQTLWNFYRSPVCDIHAQKPSSGRFGKERKY
jgi:hypothetical protein